MGVALKMGHFSQMTTLSFGPTAEPA